MVRRCEAISQVLKTRRLLERSVRLMKRKRMTRSKDVNVFKKTYSKTKRINHSSGAQQGGIRL